VPAVDFFPGGSDDPFHQDGDIDFFFPEPEPDGAEAAFCGMVSDHFNGFHEDFHGHASSSGYSFDTDGENPAWQVKYGSGLERLP
jgi:hypothetical protein